VGDLNLVPLRGVGVSRGSRFPEEVGRQAYRGGERHAPDRGRACLSLTAPFRFFMGCEAFFQFLGA